MEGEIAVARSPLRCPYCHGRLTTDEPWLACAACLGRHHEGCWEEMASCAACGGTESLARTARTVRQAGGPARLTFAGTGLLLLICAAAMALGPAGGTAVAAASALLGLAVIAPLALPRGAVFSALGLGTVAAGAGLVAWRGLPADAPSLELAALAGAAGLLAGGLAVVRR